MHMGTRAAGSPEGCRTTLEKILFSLSDLGGLAAWRSTPLEHAWSKAQSRSTPRSSTDTPHSLQHLPRLAMQHANLHASRFELRAHAHDVGRDVGTCCAWAEEPAREAALRAMGRVALDADDDRRGCGERAREAGDAIDPVALGGRCEDDAAAEANGLDVRAEDVERCAAALALGDGVDDLIDGLGGFVGDRVGAVGGEDEVVTEEAGLDEEAGGRGGGLVAVARDEVGGGRGLRGDGTLGHADEEAARAGEGLPEDVAERIAVAVAAHLDEVALGLAEWVGEGVARGVADDDLGALRAARGDDAEGALRGFAEGDRGEAEDVLDDEPADDVRVAAALAGDDGLLVGAADGIEVDLDARWRVPRHADLDERPPREAREAKAGANDVRGLDLLGSLVGGAAERVAQGDRAERGAEGAQREEAERDDRGGEKEVVGVGAREPQDAERGRDEDETRQSQRDVVRA